MCLSTVYMNLGNEQKEIMKDVAKIEAENQGYWVINLFGEKKFVEGTIESIDLIDGVLTVLGKEVTN